MKMLVWFEPERAVKGTVLAEFSPGGICADCMYEIEDLDTGDTTTVSGMDILERGLEVVVTEKRSSKVLVYHRL